MYGLSERDLMSNDPTTGEGQLAVSLPEDIARGDLMVRLKNGVALTKEQRAALLQGLIAATGAFIPGEIEDNNG